METDFPFTKMGIFNLDLFPGFQEYFNIATNVVLDVSSVTVSEASVDMEAKSKSKALIYVTQAPD